MVKPSKAIIVLNKCDLAPAELIEERKRELGPVDTVEVSAVTGQGIEDLLTLADRKLSEVAEEEGIEGKVPLSGA
jgi:50S ribosomal subunit-associated GTPase HflX